MAVEAMRRGARTFVHKPWDNAALSDAIRREVAEGRAARHADRRASREHEEAQAIQRALLPASLPALPRCDVAARWAPASAFGGDCYDVLPLDDARFAVSIADVCGKGLAAALLMSNLQASVRAFTSTDATPASVTARVNTALVRNGGLRRFVTFFYGVYDAAAGELTYVTAGHNPPVVVGADGGVRRLATGGPVLGIFESATFEQERVCLAPGDRVVLFTDGLVDAEGEGREAFGEDRLAGVVAARRGAGAAVLVDAIFEQVSRFRAGPLEDDATLVVIAVE
jgi:sigma-B regulation protein RsbU (phosphoserine phosphatase)